MKPLGEATLSVLYLFAGRPRRADMGSCLSVIADQFNNNPDFDFTVHLRVEEVDVLRGGPLHDLLSSARRKDYLMDIRSGGTRPRSLPHRAKLTRGRGTPIATDRRRCVVMHGPGGFQI